MYLYKSMREKYDEHIFLSLKDSCVWVKGWSAWALDPCQRNFEEKKSQPKQVSTKFINNMPRQNPNHNPDAVVNYQAGKKEIPVLQILKHPRPKFSHN